MEINPRIAIGNNGLSIEIPGISCLMFFVDLQRLIWLKIEYNILVLQTAVAYMHASSHCYYCEFSFKIITLCQLIRMELLL